MSRLINADEVKKAFIGNRYGTKAIEYVIDDVPTVKAIPIEWLVRKYEENLTIWKTADTVDESFRASDITMAIELITELWEKENE